MTIWSLTPQHVDVGLVQIRQPALVSTSAGEPTAQRVPTRYRTRSTNGRIGLISWVTKITELPQCPAASVDRSAP